MQRTKRREWVKTFAIIFLAILLVLTFFSNTIMNRSLPEVAAQYVESGTINAKIRGTATVAADETYDVTINQTRKIRSVMVKVGDNISAGDVLFVLEPADSEELKTAQKTLSDMELAYQKSLIEASNANSTENRDVEKLRKAYDEALAVLRLYSNADPTQITMALKTAEAELKELQSIATDAANELTEATSDSAYTEAQTNLTTAQTNYDTAVSNLETIKNTCKETLGYIPEASHISSEISNTNAEINSLKQQAGALEADIKKADSDLTLFKQTATGYVVEGKNLTNDDMYNLLVGYAAMTNIPDTKTAIEFMVSDPSLLMDCMRKFYEDDSLVTPEYANTLITSYSSRVEKETALSDAMAAQTSNTESITKLESQLQLLEQYRVAIVAVDNAETEKQYAQSVIDGWADKIKNLEKQSKAAKQAADDKQADVDRLTAASTAAETLKTAQQALEDKVFEASLGDSANLDLQNSKKAIEEQQKVVDELLANADGQEVKANVGGKISAINVTAGNSAGADTALATITVADRGYTVKIPVTADQAKKVTVGDVATITNYYNGDITATLENIANDPQNPGKGKLLVFRLTGEGVEAGANITLSIGQKSATYDCLVPNSALRNDSNGDFVLVVQAKSTPLGNRYVATRVGVTILAQDDTKTAISGLSSGDFVITTSTAPIEAGAQVRLVDNG